MLTPEQVIIEAKKKEKENLKFRTFLKNRASEKELDAQFLRLHNELFADYDCNSCRNCCKLYHGSIPARDIEKDAAYLQMTKEQFVEMFLKESQFSVDYETKNKPCDFLLENGECRLGDFVQCIERSRGLSGCF